MTRIHPKHHVRRRKLHLESMQDRINRFIENFVHVSGVSWAQASGTLTKFSEAVRREQQMAKLNALIPSLDNEQVDAILDLVTVGAHAEDMRILARNTQIGQQL